MHIPGKVGDRLRAVFLFAHMLSLRKLAWAQIGSAEAQKLWSRDARWIFLLTLPYLHEARTSTIVFDWQEVRVTADDRDILGVAGCAAFSETTLSLA